MPFKTIQNLIERQESLGDWRSKLAGNDTVIMRCEMAFETYLEARSLFFEKAQSISETKGLQGGLKRSKPLLRAKQDEIRILIAENKHDPDVGKSQIQSIAEIAHSVQSHIESEREMMMRHSGSFDGYCKMASSALDKIEIAIANHDRQLRMAEDDDEDWSGRGTDNGQRPVEVPTKKVHKKAVRKKAVRKKTVKKSTQKKSEVN